MISTVNLHPFDFGQLMHKLRLCNLDERYDALELFYIEEGKNKLIINAFRDVLFYL